MYVSDCEAVTELSKPGQPTMTQGDAAYWQENGRLPEHIHKNSCEAMLLSCREAGLRKDMEFVFDLKDRVQIFDQQVQQTHSVGYEPLAAQYATPLKFFQSLAEHADVIPSITKISTVEEVAAAESKLHALRTGARLTTAKLIRAAIAGRSELCDCADAFAHQVQWILAQGESALAQKKLELQKAPRTA